MILAKTVKGYGLGEAAEGRMTAHQQKKMGDADLLKIRDRFNLPISDEAVHAHRTSTVRRRIRREMRYLRQRIEAQGGPLPARKVKPIEIKAPAARECSRTRWKVRAAARRPPPRPSSAC